MTGKAALDRKLEFVEQFGCLLERHGMSGVGGRIIGWLAVSDPPHQSFTQLVDILPASKGSISGLTRLLVEAGFIEKIRIPGDRQSYFRLAPNVWPRMLRRQIALFEGIRDCADAAVRDLSSPSEHDLDRLREMAAFHRRFAEVLEAGLSERQTAHALHTQHTGGSD